MSICTCTDGDLSLIEPVPVEIELCTGLAAIEDLGFGLCFVTYAEQRVYETGQVTRVIKRKIVFPKAGLLPAIEMVAEAVGWRVLSDAAERVLHIVR